MATMRYIGADGAFERRDEGKIITFCKGLGHKARYLMGGDSEEGRRVICDRWRPGYEKGGGHDDGYRRKLPNGGTSAVEQIYGPAGRGTEQLVLEDAGWHMSASLMESGACWSVRRRIFPLEMVASGWREVGESSDRKRVVFVSRIMTKRGI